MNKRLIVMVLAVVCGLVGRAQYQLPNPGFEQWDGTGNTSEPTHWNSFATSDGSYASQASTVHHYRRSGHRTGGTGSYYLTIYTKKILFVNANGNMTTGRVHAGAISTTSSENYNYTQRSNSNHCQPFTGTPDSMYVWVSFYASSSSSQAQIGAIVHGDNDFRSPNDESNASLYCGKAQVRFTRTTSSASSMQWQLLKVPFEYTGTAQPHYMLLNMTTNYTPGGGSANDSLSIDDIEFIYSAWLTGIAVNGTSVEGFSMGQFDYGVVLADTAALSSAVVTVQTQVDDATPDIVAERLTDSTARVTVTVTAEDGITVKVYHIDLSAPMPVPEPEPGEFTVNVLTADAAMGTVSPAGVSVVDSAASFTVTATAAEGYQFAGWSIVPGYDNLVADNPFTFTVTSDVTVTATFTAAVGIEGTENGELRTEIYPNPTTCGDVTIGVSAPSTVTVVDMTGRVVIPATVVNSTLIIPYSTLSTGTYLVRVVSTKGIAIRKFVVSR